MDKGACSVRSLPALISVTVKTGMLRKRVRRCDQVIDQAAISLGRHVLYHQPSLWMLPRISYGLPTLCHKYTAVVTRETWLVVSRLG